MAQTKKPKHKIDSFQQGYIVLISNCGRLIERDTQRDHWTMHWRDTTCKNCLRTRPKR